MKEQLIKNRPKRRPTHPGALLREDVLPEIGISISDFARQIGVSRQVIHRILAEDQGISPAMALRIGQFVGNGPGIWLRMQQHYDLWHAQREMEKELSKIKRFRVAS